jgi:ABC-type multidrug transport system ATPase subunit
VSLRHARIGLFPEGRGYLEDLGSTNGTFINGTRLAAGERTPLRTRDVLQVGPFRLTIGEGPATWTNHSRQIGLTAVGLNQYVRKDLNLLQNLSFAIKPQEFVAVVGVSGAGKSTLLGALSGFRPASDGAVMLNGVSLYDNFDAFRTTMGYVPQDDILHKELPVQRALGYAAELRLPSDTMARERGRRIDAVIEEMGLQERRDTTVGQLSGGQRKRVSIGAELLTEPGLFYLDEATSGLDPGTESQLMRLLRRLADNGHTVVLITHATKNVMLCDQVVFLAKGGYLAYYGPPDQALTYFGVDDFDGIYLKVEGELTPAEWGERFRQSALHETFVEERLRSEGLSSTAPPRSATGLRPFTAAPPRSVGGATALRQLSVLSRRYFDIIRRDRVNIALLAFLAPILGSLDLILYSHSILSRTTGDATRAMTMLFLAALIPFLVGALTFVREIVKEAPIYSRERAVSLGIWPYLGSKIAVGVPLALYHAGMLFLIKSLAVEFPGVTAAGFTALYITLALACISGVMWALLISTVTTKEEQAMLLVIALIILQMTFSGHVVPLASLGLAGTVLGGINSTAWAYKALAAAAGIGTNGCSGDFLACNVPGVAGKDTLPARQLTFDTIDKAFGGVLDADVVVCWMAMVAIIAVLGIILVVLQKRKDKL